MADNSINFIQKLNFKALPVTEKVRIKELGRPTPNLNLHQQDKMGMRIFMRHFSKDITYNKFKWIAGCDQTNALFCFPCVLFCSDETDRAWSVSGFKDLKHLNHNAKIHEISPPHIHCCMELNLLGSSTVGVRLDPVYRRNIIKHNEKVTKNRYLLKKLINCIKFCGKLDFMLSEDAEKEDSIFCELIDFSSEIDLILKEHLNKSCATVFKETSNTLQNEILESMLAVCCREIKRQINQTDFLAIQCDETSDISNQYQMAIIVRYYHNGNIYERFWSFFKATKNLTQCIENEIDELISNSSCKLIAQTYDGANVTSGPNSSIQARIKDKYNQAHFIHSYAHQLNLIIQKATDENTKIKLFFSNLSAIPAFFSNPTHKCHVFEETVKRMVPKINAACFNYDIHTVTIVYENRDEFIECFKELEEACNKTITCKEAYNLRTILQDPNFIFWLNFFNNIFPRAHVLFNLLETGTNDKLKMQLEEFQLFLLSVRKETDDNTNKRRKVVPVIVNKVCDSIHFLIKERLSYRGHLEVASLVDTEKFIFYSQNFPELTFRSVVRNYYPIFEHDKLKIELKVLYSNKHFRNIKGALNMLSWLCENDLNETFSELVKLLKILVTTPMPTIESERCFSTLKKVKAFLRSHNTEERLNALAMMSVNKNLIHNINNFDEKVVEHFISRGNRGPDFIYVR